MSENVGKGAKVYKTKREVQAGQRKYLRFSLSYIFEHWVLSISFIILALTGLPQKFSAAGISKGIIALLGGIESVRVIHRAAAVGLMLITVYHIGALLYRMYVLRYRATMLPGMQDVRNAIGALLYNLGLRKNRPQEGRYTFEEKAEYWALVWGTVIMIVTGFMLWNPIATTNFLPGQWIPAARTAHGGEALLAVLAIILWHFYGVLIKTFNRSMYNGHLTEEEMLHEHPLELADIKAGLDRQPVPKRLIERRQMIFVPVFTVLAALLFLGIYQFVSFEETAVAFVPPAEDVEVFAPLTPTPLPTAQPTPTQGPTAAAPEGAPAQALAWEGEISALFEARCTACHGSGAKTAGLDLSSYAAALAGGSTGPAVVPGESETSLVFTRQAAGNHPGQFSADELEKVVAWIEAGAPETGEAGEAAGGQAPPDTPQAGATATPGSIAWYSTIRTMLGNRCSVCHNASDSSGGLDITTYGTARAGGSSGPGFVPGDPAASWIVQVQQAGDHPGQLSPQEIQILIDWIEAGAPEE